MLDDSWYKIITKYANYKIVYKKNIILNNKHNILIN